MAQQFQYQQHVKPVLHIADINADKLSWSPLYPDFTRSKNPIVQTGLVVGDIIFEILPEPPTEFEGSWGGYQPSILWKEIHIGYQAHAEPIFPPAITDPQFWAFFPEYPDFTRSRKLSREHITEPFVTGSLEDSLLIPPYDPQEMDWFFYEPRFARSSQPNVMVGRTMFAVRKEFPLSAWFPIYPDFASTKKVTIEKYRWMFGEVLEETLFVSIEDLRWNYLEPVFAKYGEDRIRFPHLLPFLQWHTETGPDVPEPPPEAAPWYYIYRIRRQR